MTRYKPLKEKSSRQRAEADLILAALEELLNRELSRSDELYGEDKQEELGEYLSAIRMCRAMRDTNKPLTLDTRQETMPWPIDDDVQ